MKILHTFKTPLHTRALYHFDYHKERFAFLNLNGLIKSRSLHLGTKVTIGIPR